MGVVYAVVKGEMKTALAGVAWQLCTAHLKQLCSEVLGAAPPLSPQLDTIDTSC